MQRVDQNEDSFILGRVLRRFKFVSLRIQRKRIYQYNDLERTML